MSATALLIVAHGSEELETTTIHNLLTRAGVAVTLAKSCSNDDDAPWVDMARGLTIKADARLSEVSAQAFDVIVIPGGVKGAQALAEDSLALSLLRNQLAQQKWVGAICAAPALTLAPHGLLAGLEATCYPGFEDYLPQASNQRVVVSNCLVTSQGPGTAIDFTLTLIEKLLGADARRKTAEQILHSPLS